MNEQALKTISEFCNLPETDEIKEIKRQYLSEEISLLELFSIANKYLEEIKS